MSAELEEPKVQPQTAKERFDNSRKAWLGGALSGLIAFGAGLVPYMTNGSFADITDAGWLIAALAGLVGFGTVTGLVYGVENKQPTL